MTWSCPWGSSEAALEAIERRAAEDPGRREAALPAVGGEHLVTLGAVRAAARRFPDLCILHFDAHADLRRDYLGVALSHACVLRRCWELVGDGRIVQLGIRSGDREEWRWGREHVTCRPFDLQAAEAEIAGLGQRPGLCDGGSGRAGSVGLSRHRDTGARRRQLRQPAPGGDPWPVPG